MKVRSRCPGWKILIGCVVALATTAGVGIPARDARAADSVSERDSSRAAELRPGGAARRWQEASPSERRELRALARERWQNATPRERRIFVRAMRGLARALPEFSLIERRLLFRKIVGLSEAERESMRSRLRRIDDLDPGERELFVAELRGLLDESPEETARIERNIDRWRAMPESERETYREQMRRFRSMSSEERQAVLDEWEAPAAGDRKDAPR